MEALRFVALFAVLCGVLVEAGKFENFVVNVEEITKINDECKDTVTECKETVDEQKDTINELKAALASNLTGKIEVLEETNTNQTNRIAVLEAADEECKQSVANLTDKMQTLEAKNEALNTTLTAIQGKVYHLVRAGKHLIRDAVVDHCLPFAIMVYETGSPIP